MVSAHTRQITELVDHVQLLLAILTVPHVLLDLCFPLGHLGWIFPTVDELLGQAMQCIATALGFTGQLVKDTLGLGTVLRRGQMTCRQVDLPGLELLLGAPARV
ncbi:hypothetical protein D3C84_477850 [compost metagenome]